MNMSKPARGEQEDTAELWVGAGAPPWQRLSSPHPPLRVRPTRVKRYVKERKMLPALNQQSVLFENMPKVVEKSEKQDWSKNLWIRPST